MLIALLGPLEVRTADGTRIEIRGARLRGLLAALALEPGQLVPTTTLVDWIWGEHPPAEATNALQRLVSRLRKALPNESIDGRPNGYLLRAAPEDVDAARFEQLLDQAGEGPRVQRVRLLREALGRWRGDAMQDIGLRDSARLDAAVTRLEERRLAALQERFELEIRLGHGPRLIAELTDAVATHPLREGLAAALMRALGAAGRGPEALLVYERTRTALADALGVDPSPELSALHLTLLRGGSMRQDEHRGGNIRAELTSFVGRDTDLTGIAALIAGHRLVTLAGPGGAGKTRLATETARHLRDDLPDGVWLVELAAIGADGDPAQATLDALGLRDPLRGDAPNSEPTDRVIAAIRDRETLLVLDNCEHLIDAAAAFAHRALGECGRLRILATSRQPLGITGEALWQVAPLVVPGQDATAGEIAASSAVRLLRDRAAAVRTDLPEDAATVSTMGRVCRALDGMPLAIELAAARLRTMSLTQLADRLDDRFRLLTGGSRTAPPQHRTLRAVVDWSWELLTEDEGRVLRRLAVFSGGASLAAAEQVCAGVDIQPTQVFELLTALIEKSLVATADDGAPRYRMLSLIQEYAAERLAAAGETEATRQAHLAYFTRLAEQADPNLRRAEQLEWLPILVGEHDNLGAAMRGALAAGEADRAMRLASVAGFYWWLSGHKAEGMELITAAIDLPGEVPDETRALVYALMVMFVDSGPGDEHQAEEWIRRAHRFSSHSPTGNHLLALVRPMERMLHGLDVALPEWESLLDNADPWVAALARLQLGKTYIMLGHAGEEADRHLAMALDDFRSIGERWGISFAHSELADRMGMRGEFTRACRHYEQAIEAVGELGAIEDISRMRARQAQLHWLLGDATASAAALAEAQRTAERVTWPDALALLAVAMATLAGWRGDTEQARRHLDAMRTFLGGAADRAINRVSLHDLSGYLTEDLDESRAHRRAAYHAATEAGHAPLVAQALVGLADLALRGGEPAQAARLLAAASRVRGLPDRANPEENRIARTARSLLGAAGFAAASREGAAAEVDQLTPSHARELTGVRSVSAPCQPDVSDIVDRDGDSNGLPREEPR
ncbi:BTAD domain-containing putative transcriptional regulator [Actinoalloteichus hymeniacidonis]|uniref:ATPase n=1 Tax=Actinoalloteichus hymeniacidonis TaxID=340345 RepID=A0AAC9HS98_9PSEU|nr:BTAD domain-containing putative transcriptional regulator [Actinoalloteichus hymeniacidonis]AOS64548.1 putative ATPase [Actinoalloteichus hymeniacidonis]MBB5907380.1 putative ATPase [Actinoalloteichus hymeniacidonis]